jgi:Polyketide cyclase / dehydrase and lipid transport
MAEVFVSSVIAAPAGTVWRVVRDFNGLPNWTPFVVESRIEHNLLPDQVGCIRSFRLKDGGKIRERLLALSDFDMSCTYSILESPMEVENYIATLALFPITDGNVTLATWKASFDAVAEREDELVRDIGANVFQAAFSALKKQLVGR